MICAHIGVKYLSSVTIYSLILSVNLALGKPTSQSSIYGGKVSSRAVDGNKDGMIFLSGGVVNSESCTHTDMEDDPWFRLDLQDTRSVGRVSIVSRNI